MKTVLRSVIALGLLFGSGALSATSYVPVTDASLVDQAPVIVVAEAQGAGSNAAGMRPATTYPLRVERVLKGAMPSGLAIQVQVPGGVRADGIGLRIWGAPRFAKGERAVLFLAPRVDGSYEILHLMQGAFYEVRVQGRRFAVRHLAEATPVTLPGQALQRESLRDFDRFVAWVADAANAANAANTANAARGIRRQADYEVPDRPRLRRAVEEFVLTTDPGDGLPLRWFFETSVEWLAHQTGQQGLTGGGFPEFNKAVASWGQNPGTGAAIYSAGNTTDNTHGLITYDTVNAILFNDPNGEISPYVCGSGGTLAMGGPWYETATTLFQGNPYHRILNADIVVNDGISCFFSASLNASKAAEEIFGHELGHTLGLGHSSVSEALMRPSVHDDGRGSALHTDDRTGIATLYPIPDYYSSSAASSELVTIPPCRLLDTRNPDGSYGGPAFKAGFLRVVSVAHQCGIPGDAIALSANITAVSPTSSGYLRLFPPERPEPITSAVNFSSGVTRSNNSIVLLSFNLAQAFVIVPGMSTGTVHVVVDVNGYYQFTGWGSLP